ncbi:MAG: hypothetical protein KKH12_03395 [Gammaproteobacteria bacterium]|nr:hypothetical protein [Gammaproteobacteria bacterium]MBU1480700.1 hypothetical protein [Gammaproteobacteria bacterium]
MKWAIEIQKTSLEQRNLADLLKGLGFDLIQGIEYPALSSPTIDVCATAADAFEMAKDVRAAFKGPAKIDPEFALGSVIDYASTPPRRHAFLEVAPCVMKITCGTATITISPPKGLSSDELAKWHEEHNERQYQVALERQRALLEPAFIDPKAAKAIELLCIENPSGETLYKIYELAEGHPSNRPAFHAEFEIDKEQFNRFKDAVHNPAVTGDWARHAYHQEPNTLDPMTRAEAEQFVRRVADRWLQSIRRSK